MAIRYASSLDGIRADDLRGGFWVGWPEPPTPATHLALLRGSEAFVLAIDDEAAPETPGRVVGFVSAVGDGVLAAYVPFLEVLPAWQGRGIGRELMRRILAELEPRYMVDLVCDDEIVPFYERLGFVPYRAMIRRDREAITAGSSHDAGRADRAGASRRNDPEDRNQTPDVMDDGHGGRQRPDAREVTDDT